MTWQRAVTAIIAGLVIAGLWKVTVDFWIPVERLPL